MPREGSSDVARKMGRHQACHRCRRRKLKCDGAMPCGPCQRAHAYEVRTRPTTAPAEPPCVYDHPDLVTDGPKGRIANLENEIAELRELLEVANGKLARCTCGAAATLSEGTLDSESFSPSASDSGQHSTSADMPFVVLERSPATIDEIVAETSLSTSAFSALPAGTFFPSNPSGDVGILQTPTISSFYSSSFLAESIGSVTLDVFPSAWPPNLPPPFVLYHLVETFFTSVPLASRLIHKPSFMVRQLPTSLDFPALPLLHAICGIASLYSPVITDPKLDKARENASEGLFGPSVNGPLDPGDNETLKRRFPKSLYDLKGAWDEGFGVAHIRFASTSLRLSVREGDRLLQMLQAAIICTWYTYSMGMTIGVYTWMGTVTKLVGPLGIYTSEGFEPLSRLPSNMLFLFGKPKTPVEAETLRNVFWITYVMERVYNAGTAWPLATNDEDISQMMPCRFADFISGEHVPTHNRQRLFTENMLLTHPTLMTDSWTLYIKGAILISRVRSFNGRHRISTVTRSGTTPMMLQESPTESEDFRDLDQTIAAFIRDMPRAYRDPVGTTVDPLLYVAHLLPHVAMIQLHDPHAKPHSPNDYSAMQMLSATRAILNLIYKLCGTAYDLLYMDHSCSFAWFLAGATIIRFLKVKIDAKDEEEVMRLEQELGAVKFMLRNLGDRTIVGYRQISVLDEIYSVEIKGHGRKAATAPSATDQRAETDNLMFGNVQ